LLLIELEIPNNTQGIVTLQFVVGSFNICGVGGWVFSAVFAAADSDSEAYSALGLAYMEIHFKSIHIKNRSWANR